jgi:two-component system sensor histidine kinase RegB
MANFEVRQVVAWRLPVQWATSVILWIVFATAIAWPELGWPLHDIAIAGFACALLRTTTLALDRSGRQYGALSALSIAGDTVLLTGLLDITGGPFNPFLVMYAVEVWLAAVTVSTAAAVFVGVIAAVGGGWLVVDHLQAGLAEHHRLNDFPTHLFTMWFTGSTIAELVAHYVARARSALAQRQRELDDARERALRSERLASLTTLAAGAAHELSTPLSTIAVAAKELDRNARASTDQSLAATLGDDVRLIQQAVGRCRAILDGLSGRATGEVASIEPMTADAVVAMACESLPPDRRERITLDVAAAPDQKIASGVEVSRALSSLLKNAFDASRDRQLVELRATGTDLNLRFEVRDQGHGMSADAERRAGEPFYTTKPAGEGLGLGLFLARTVAEQRGGTLRFERGQGTIAILEIPMTQAPR